METWLLILLSLTLCAALLRLAGPKNRRLPPGPLSIPILGNPLWLRRSFQEIEPLLRELHAKYGPIVTLHVGSRTSIFISDRSLAHSALVSHGAAFSDRPTPLPATRFLSANQHNISSAAYGPLWRLLRRNLISEILHPTRVQIYAPGREWVLSVLTQHLHSKSQSPNGVVAMESFQFAMFCLLVLMCFGEKLDEKAILGIEVAQRNLLLNASTLNIFAFVPRLAQYLFRKRWSMVVQLRQRIKELYVPLIRARRAHKRTLKDGGEGEESRYVFSYLDSLLDVELQEGRGLTDDEMVSLCSEFLNAGTDTTSTALQWIMAELVRHPEIQNKLVEEVESVVGREANEVSEEELAAMPYLKAVVKEGLRRHPPGHFVLPHAVTEEVEIGGYVIPKGASVNFMVAEMNMDKTVWDEPSSLTMVSITTNGDDTTTHADSPVDFKGNPVDKNKTGGWLGAGLILGAELAERICVVGIIMNLVTYLVGNLHLSTSKSANMVTNFMGSLNLLALLGGFLADAKLGRYMTVALFSTITATGVSLLTIATSVASMKPPPCTDFRQQQHQCTAATGSQLVLLYAALYTIALGGGGIKANVSGFGSDQFDTRDPKEEKAMIFFFSRFYFFISLGSLFAVTVLVYIQDNVSRGLGYGISAAAMVVAVAVLLAGTPFYRYRRPQGSPLAVIWRVLAFAWRKRKLQYPSHPSFLNGYDEARVPHTEKFRCLDKAAILACSEQGTCTAMTVTHVEEVKMVLKLIPIWSTCILFWTIYSQMTTFSVEQATYMNRHIGRSFVYPSGSLSLFLFISILTFTSLNEKFLVPFARRFTHSPQGLTSLQRVAVGLIFSTLAMIAAAIVEQKRRETAVQNGIKLRVFWLVPQYVLVGAGEAFGYVGQLEFFIREAPERMKSMSTGLFLAAISMGFFLSSVLVSLVDKVTDGSWIMNNLNKGKLNYFYWMLAVLSVINFVFFSLLARQHEYKVQNFNNKNPVVEMNGLESQKDGNGDDKVKLEVV